MARNFVAASSQYIDLGSSVPQLTGNWTIAGWFKRTAINHYDYLWMRYASTVANRQIGIYVADNTAGAQSNKLKVDVPWIAAILVGATNIDANWHHMAVTRSGNNWVLYLDGSVDASGTNAASQENGLSPYLGKDGPNSAYANADMAEFACWTAALDAMEIRALGKGFSPHFVRRASLGGYWPLIGRDSPEPDRVKRNEGTLNGSPANANHTRIIYPDDFGSGKLSSGAGGGGSSIPVLYQHYQKLRRAG